MKICVISSCVIVVPPPGYSGLEMIVWQCARGLAELGHEVTLIAPEGSSCPNCKVINCGRPGQWDESHAFKTYSSHLLEANYDAIIDHSWSKFSLSHKPYLKTPVLCVMHAPVNGMLQSLPPNTDKPCFVCISQDQANHFDALFNYKPRVCHNGIDLSFYKDTQVGRTNRFLFLARFSTIKGPDLAIEACLRAGVGLDLVGDTSITNEPEYFHKCMELAKRWSPNWDHSKGEQIRVIGGVSRSETVHWYSRSHCMIHPNQRFREPLGLAPLEAMACGLPVIGWRYGALKETVKEGVSGLLVNSFDELVKAIQCDWFKNITEDDRLGCRQWVQDNFTVQRMVLRYEELSKEAVETGGW